MNTCSSVALLAVAMLALPASALAQRMPLPDSGGRVLQAFDLQRLAKNMSGDTRSGAESARMVELLGAFVTPALQPDDDLQLLANRWLTLVGSPEQLASLDRLLQHVLATREDLITCETRLSEVSAETFGDRLRPLLERDAAGAQERFQVVLGKEQAQEFAAAADKAGSAITAPSLMTYSLDVGNIQVMEQIPYVRDYCVRVQADHTLLDPIVDTVFAGYSFTVCSMSLPDGNLAVSCRLEHRQVDQPLAQVEVRPLPDLAPVKVQLPRSTAVDLDSVAEMAPGSVLVVAAPRSDGSMLVATITARREAR